ncbi:unnamed protein product [Discosporangium mesarthrocarpum]
MDFTNFKILYELVRPQLERDPEMDKICNGVVAGEWALAASIRSLAGRSYFETIDDLFIAKSTAFSVLHKTIEGLNTCPHLAITWSRDGFDEVAEGFKSRSEQGIIDRCVERWMDCSSAYTNRLQRNTLLLLGSTLNKLRVWDEPPGDL